MFLKTSPTDNSESQFQLLIEMTVKFVKSKESEMEIMEIMEIGWYNERDFYSGDGDTQCIEQRNINEYSSFASGPVEANDFVYQDAMFVLSQKVLNSHNVTGSNRSLRRIISSNLSVLHNIDSKVFAQMLVKGRLPEPTTTTATSSATAAAANHNYR